MSNRKNKKYNLVIVIFSLFISLLHFILSLLGKVNIIGVFCSVMFSSIVSLIMYCTFESSIRHKDFSLIAGHKKLYESNFPIYKRQLKLISLLVSAFSLLLNILYFAVYGLTADQQMPISLIFFLVFIIGLPSFIFIVKYKYKKYFEPDNI